MTGRPGAVAVPRPRSRAIREPMTAGDRERPTGVTAQRCVRSALSTAVGGRSQRAAMCQPPTGHEACHRRGEHDCAGIRSRARTGRDRSRGPARSRGRRRSASASSQCRERRLRPAFRRRSREHRGREAAAVRRHVAESQRVLDGLLTQGARRPARQEDEQGGDRAECPDRGEHQQSGRRARRASRRRRPHRARRCRSRCCGHRQWLGLDSRTCQPPRPRRGPGQWR